jgi:hypothetical protein
VVHVAGPVDGGWRLIEVWDSRGAYNDFVRDRLLPAIVQVAGEDALDEPFPAPQIMEVHGLLQ